jgi:hypothetical protein
MNLLVLQDVNLSPLDCRFRQSPLAQFGAFLLFASLAVGAFCWYRFGDLPLLVTIFSGGFLGLISLLFFSIFKKSLAPTNWILAVGPDRILIKFRSYLNAHFPSTDPQVAQFHPSELRSAGITKQRITAPGSGNGYVTSFHTFLDLHVSGAVLSPLQERLKYERTVKVQTGTRIKSSSKARHYPVSVIDSDTIRIEWRSPQDVVVPGAKKALAVLSRFHVSIEAINREVIDLTEDCAAAQKSTEDKILLLAERGNLMAATKLARRVYKLNLTEAKQFVEELLE